MFLSDAALARLRDAAAPVTGPERYEILEEIGRGGMGTVYLALDSVLNREVAIKVPNTSPSAGLEHRLQMEARALASLEHPGIVPIHDAGRLADGRVFYVMKRVRGRTLREHMAAIDSTTERLRVFERICEAVAFAHAQGFIHRDLKPDNVMIGAFGEVMVMDWGVARQLAATDGVEASALTTDDGTTNPGSIVGTRGFMAPEQARGSSDAVDVRADIYSLGALLLLLLTGDAPPETQAAASVTARRNLPKPLRAVCARALAVDPAERYSSVTELGDDIARYRSGDAVLAQRETLADRAWRFGRTYRTAILLILAYVIMRAAVALFAGR